MDDRKILITASQRSWGKEMFSQVSVNLLQGGWYLWNQVPSEGGYVQGGGHSPPWTWDLRKGGYSPTALPPRTWDTTEYSQRAGCSHATEMHSCCRSIYEVKIHYLHFGDAIIEYFTISGQICFIKISDTKQD